MKTRLLISGLLILFVMVIIPAMAQEDDCVEMDIEIESTKNLDWKTCYLEKYASLLIKTSSEEPTDNKIILQKDTFWNYGADCSPTRFFTLINGEENFSKEEYFGDYRILSIHLEEGENEIEIIRAVIIPEFAANEYCLTKSAEPIPEPEPSFFSDEQDQMMREYCETGIRHPDMIGIPQCIKNEPGCGPGPMFVDGICHVIKYEKNRKKSAFGRVLRRRNPSARKKEIKNLPLQPVTLIRVY